MPSDVPAPEVCPDQEERYIKLMAEPGLSEKGKLALQGYVDVRLLFYFFFFFLGMVDVNSQIILFRIGSEEESY